MPDVSPYVSVRSAVPPSIRSLSSTAAAAPQTMRWVPVDDAAARGKRDVDLRTILVSLEIAENLGVSKDTAPRDWRFAKERPATQLAAS